MSDLLVSSHTPTLGVGRALRTYAIARALATHAPLDLLYIAFGADEPSPEYLEHPKIRLHPVNPSRGLRRAMAYVSARAAGTPDQLARGVNAELGSCATELAAATGEGRVIADGMTVRMCLRRLGRQRPVIFNGQNLESGFHHHLGGRKGYGDQATLQRFERKIFAWSDETWMVSHKDVAGARALCPEATVRYVPNVVDVSAITPLTDPPRSGVILFVADFTWLPNQEAVEFLIDAVMPAVWAQRSDARLALVGRGLELGRSLDARVERLGFVDDLDEQYARSACAVVPLLSGGGSPLKFVEALAHGLPVVATPLAAQGLQVAPGEHYIQADGAQAVARALVRILADGAGDVAAAGRELAEREYSIEALSEILAPSAEARP